MKGERKKKSSGHLEVKSETAILKKKVGEENSPCNQDPRPKGKPRKERADLAGTGECPTKLAQIHRRVYLGNTTPG